MTYSTTRSPQSAAAAAASGQEITPAGDELSRPREFVENGTKAHIYQPEIEKWEGNDFETRSAVAITPAGSNAPVYGVFWMNSRADVDKAARIVTLNVDIEVTEAVFPSSPESQGEYLALVGKHVPGVTKTVAFDHLEASHVVSEAKKAGTVPVRNDPPHIFFCTVASLLVLVNGPPALRPPPGLDIARVINSRALILKLGSVSYLNASDHWRQALDVAGPWTLAPNAPPELGAAKQAALAGGNVDLMTRATRSLWTSSSKV